MIEWTDQVHPGVTSYGSGAPSDPPDPNYQWSKYLNTDDGGVWVWTLEDWILIATAGQQVDSPIEAHDASSANTELTLDSEVHTRNTRLSRVSVNYRDGSGDPANVTADVTVTLLSGIDPTYNALLGTISLSGESEGTLLASVLVRSGDQVEVVAGAGGSGNIAYVQIVEV